MNYYFQLTSGASALTLGPQWANPFVKAGAFNIPLSERVGITLPFRPLP